MRHLLDFEAGSCTWKSVAAPIYFLQAIVTMDNLWTFYGWWLILVNSMVGGYSMDILRIRIYLVSG